MSITHTLPDSESLASRCAADGEFCMAARFWSGELKLAIADRTIRLAVDNGEVNAAAAETHNSGADELIVIAGPMETWEKFLAPVPERLYTELLELAYSDKLTIEANPIRLAQYYPAIARVIELLRAPTDTEDPTIDESGDTPRYDTPVGRYIHLELDDHDYRIYYEEAGRGIPLLMQHTAGAHGTQYRHLFENRQITDNFRLIAYDLPFHGKSIPPVTKQWWTEEYRLSPEFARALPIELANALELENPIFMGCSVGGMLALDLAYHHPEAFHSVISLEGAIKVGHQDFSNYALVWHPQISNEFKARAMNGAMSPTSPERYRRETMQIYAAGWPPAFYGDLHYYLEGYDLTGKAQDIDTEQCGVYILSGKYDISGTTELAIEAHQAIKGSELSIMENMGHFPMSENPLRFIEYLLPVLDKIKSHYPNVP